MRKTIELDNNFYLEIIEDIEDKSITNINDLYSKNIFKQDKFVIKIDFNELKPIMYKKILKRLIIIKSKCKRTKIKIGIENGTKILLGYVLNFDEKNKMQNDFLLAINAIFYNSRYERYNYIYNNVCNYLDSFFYGKNLCSFKNDYCRSDCRKENDKVQLNGCCYHGRVRWLGPLFGNVPCEYLTNEHTCGAQCISCKLFTCDYLRKKGIVFKINEILLLDVFFNPVQKFFIKYMVFTPKEKILKRLMRT